MRTRNYMAIGGSLIGKPPKGFVAEGEPVEQQFNDSRFLGRLQLYSRGFRLVRSGALLTGAEHRRIFVGGVPDSVLLPPEVLTSFNPTFPARGLLWSDELKLVRVDGGCSGDPTLIDERHDLVPYFSNRYREAPEEAWEKTVAWTLALGFGPEDLATFSTASVECITALRESAHSFITQHLGMLHPRSRLETYKKAAGVLRGFSKAEAASSEARALFDEALLEAVTAATAAGLLALVETLTGAEGGAATA